MGRLEKPVNRTRELVTNMVSLTPLILCMFFYVLPLLMWWAGLPGRSYSVTISALYFAQIWTTVTISLVSAASAVFFGWGTACLAAFSGPRVRNLLAFAMTIPLLMGFVARNFSWMGLLSQFQDASGLGGLIGQLLDSKIGVIVVMTTVFIPFCFFIVLQATDTLRPEYFQAARTLGTSDFRSFFVITVPFLGKSAALAFWLSFVLALGYFITPELIGGGNSPFVGNGVLRLLNELGDLGGASMLAFYLFLTALLPVIATALFVGWVAKRRERFVYAFQADVDPGSARTSRR